MEVHHPHHPSHKKKWNEYLLEFFMLFFAVSLGFLAENIREHYVEKERAHELLSSFVRDVETNINFTDSLVNNNRRTILKNEGVIKKELIPIIARKNYLTSAIMRTADIVYQ